MPRRQSKTQPSIIAGGSSCAICCGATNVPAAFACWILEVGKAISPWILRRAFPRAELAGVELSASGIAEARGKVPSARFLQHDLLDPHDDPGPLRSWAQYAVCAEVLEHLDHPELFLKQVGRYLAPGCTLVVYRAWRPKIGIFDRHIGHRRQHFTPGMLRVLCWRPVDSQCISQRPPDFRFLICIASW